MRGDNYKIEDRILLKKAACDGCNDSLAVIYGKYRPIVYDYLKRAGADGMAEDICQTVFMRLCEGSYNYDGLPAADDYLCVAAKNLLRNHRRVKIETPYPPQKIEDLNTERMIDIQPDPLETAEEHQFLKELIAELPLKSRQAIEMAFMGTPKGGDTIRKHVTGDPDPLRMRLKYAIKLLRGKINGP